MQVSRHRRQKIEQLRQAVSDNTDNSTDTSPDDLVSLRRQIDAVDDDLLRLINERAQCARRVGYLKSAQADQADGGGTQIYRPEREAEILRRVKALNKGPLSDAQVSFFFRELISTCLSLEAPIQVAYLGPPGSFSAEAAYKHFGHAARHAPMDSIDAIFREVETGRMQYAVVPLENSTEGAVGRSMDMLLATPLKICGEVLLRIHQNLLSRAEHLQAIETVYSHTQSLAQCHEWLNAHLPGVERVAVASNSLAAEMAAKDPRTAAIAGAAAARLFELDILADHIEDEANNSTRFIVLGTHDTQPTGQDKTSLIISTPHRAGSLIKALAAFSEVNISMTRLESRPAREMLWDYVFHVDIEGHRDDIRAKMALSLLEERAAFVKILGSYPLATS